MNPAGTCWSVLLVDDEELICENLRLYFEDEHHTVHVAGDVSGALAVLAEYNVDLAIVDLGLSLDNGEELVRRIAVEYPNTGILIHTGTVRYQFPPELYDLGLTEEHILYKPIQNYAELSRRIYNIMNKKPV